jgi:hypothetical protein
MFPWKPYAWRDLNPGFLIPEADTMSTTPRRQRIHLTMFPLKTLFIPSLELNPGLHLPKADVIAIAPRHPGIH